MPGAKAEAVPLDLGNLASVRALAQKCLDSGHPLDVLVNNAGKCHLHPCKSWGGVRATALEGLF